MRNFAQKLLILPCSSAKTANGIVMNESNDYFTHDANLQLRRNERMNYYNNLLNDRPSHFKTRLNYYQSAYNNNQYLRAIDRYNGNLYHDEVRNALLLKIQEGKLDLLIISGLYGVLKYDDHIIDYHLEISKGGLGMWNINGINSVRNAVVNYIQIHHFNANDVYYMLAGSYPTILNPINFTNNLNLWVAGAGDNRGRGNRDVLINFLNGI